MVRSWKVAASTGCPCARQRTGGSQLYSSHFCFRVFPFLRSSNMACHMNLAADGNHSHSDVHAHPPPAEAHIKLLLPRAASFFRSHFALDSLEQEGFLLSQGLEPILPEESVFVGSIYHGTRAPGLGLPVQKPLGCRFRRTSAPGGICRYCNRKGLWLSFYGGAD